MQVFIGYRLPSIERRWSFEPIAAVPNKKKKKGIISRNGCYTHPNGFSLYPVRTPRRIVSKRADPSKPYSHTDRSTFRSGVGRQKLELLNDCIRVRYVMLYEHRRYMRICLALQEGFTAEKNTRAVDDHRNCERREEGALRQREGNDRCDTCGGLSGEMRRNEGQDEGSSEQRQQKSKGVSTTRSKQRGAITWERATGEWRRW